MATVAVWKVNWNREVKLEPLHLKITPTTLDKASEQLPGGAYTTFRTFQSNRVMHLQDHLKRLEETARLLNIPVLLEEEAVRTALRQAINQYPSVEKRVRLTVDLQDKAGSLYVQIEPLKVPTIQDYLEGVRVVTRRMERLNPKAKLTSFIATAESIRQELPAGINEALMVSEQGRILEGLSSNFFAVQNEALWTAEEGVLSGITRSIVLSEAGKEGLPIHFEGVTLNDLPGLDEAFITSSSRAVLPVTRIDGGTVGLGRPGPITKKLFQRYQQCILAETEPI